MLELSQKNNVPINKAEIKNINDNTVLKPLLIECDLITNRIDDQKEDDDINCTSVIISNNNQNYGTSNYDSTEYEVESTKIELVKDKNTCEKLTDACKKVNEN